MSVLYVIATPIGNLEDISLRALRLLREVDLIAAEDTRAIRHLLSAYGIKAVVTSYHEHNKLTKLDYLLGYLQTHSVALVSEAGTPGLSDPGYELITAAIRQGVRVIPIPGASAVIAALVVSGLPSDQFLYIGFLPRRGQQRKRLLVSLAGEARTVIAFESPHRLKSALNDILESLGDRDMAVCRELTKIHEEVFWGRVSQAIEHFTEPRGEFTLVIRGKMADDSVVTDRQAEELRKLYQQGMGARDAVAQVAHITGLSKNRLYRTWLKLMKENQDRMAMG
jgi:16S rRNA (cytidine1402-2'-O)-methyltransferase